MTAVPRTDDLVDAAHLSVTVHGRVQGVYFRRFVRNAANKLSLKGYVRNLAGGSAVEVQAEGEKPRLNELLEQLKAGSLGARVKEVEVAWSAYSGQFTDFSIRYR